MAPDRAATETRPVDGRRSESRTVRVALGELPRLLRDVIAAALADFPGFELVEMPAECDVVVIAGRPGVTPATARAVLDQHPRASIVVVVSATDADSVVRYELWPQATDLGEPTVARLIEALHGATPWEERFVPSAGATS
jgi:hypothetical protein